MYVCMLYVCMYYLYYIRLSFLIVFLFIGLFVCLFFMYVFMYCTVCMYVCMYASKSSTLNKSCVCGCSSCIDQEEQLLSAAREGRLDEVASLLDQGVDIQCKDEVRIERID